MSIRKKLQHKLQQKLQQKRTVTSNHPLAIPQRHPQSEGINSQQRPYAVAVTRDAAAEAAAGQPDAPPQGCCALQWPAATIMGPQHAAVCGFDQIYYIYRNPNLASQATVPSNLNRATTKAEPTATARPQIHPLRATLPPADLHCFAMVQLRSNRLA